MGGSSKVNPDDYTDKIIIAFTNRMYKAQVFDTSPEFPYKDELSEDGMSLVITFLNGYKMPDNTNFVIKFYGVNYSSLMPLIGIKFCYPPEPDRYIFKTIDRHTEGM